MPHKLLIDSHTLDAHLTDPNWVIVDCRFALADPSAGEVAYRRDHIPGAYYAHLDRDLSAPVGPRTGRHPLPEPQKLAQRLSRWGMTQQSQLVAYDDDSAMFAARLWWLSRWLGHDQVAVLDGGYRQWREQGLAIATQAPPERVTDFAASPERSLWLDANQVQALVADSAGNRLLDARAGPRYRGEQEPLDPRAGHIPGARNLPQSGNTADDGRFLSPETLRARFESTVADLPPEAVVHTCGSGVSACHNLLAMELAGLSGSRLYPGSWSEWSSDPARPAETGDAKRPD